MTTCLIVDDEPLAIKVMQSHLDPLNDVEVVATFTSALDAFAFLQERPVDLLFLDIQMPRLTGLDLVAALQDPPKIILTTAYREYAVEGFDLDVVDYLLKPISLPRLLRALDKYHRLTAKVELGEAPPSPHYLTLRVDRQAMRVLVGDIWYVESLSDYVKVHTSERTLVTRERISHLEKTLAPHGFLRIHRSFLVATAAVTAFTADEVHVAEGPRLPIGRTYRQAVLARLSDGRKGGPSA